MDADLAGRRPHRSELHPQLAGEHAAGPGTRTIYVLITLAAVLRVLSPLAGDRVALALGLAGLAWSGAFGLFAILYGKASARPRVRADAARTI